MATTREQPSARQETQTRRERTERREARGQRNKQHTAPRPRAPAAGNQRKPETKGAQKKGGTEQEEKNKKKQHTPAKGGRREKRGVKAKGTRGRKPKNAGDNGGTQEPTTEEKKTDQVRGNPSPEGAEQSRKPKPPKEKVRRTRTRPGGRPARPGQDGRAHAHTHGTPAWRPPTRKGRCQRPHKTALVHWPRPPSKDGRYGKPEALVTGSTHANNRRARSPRPTPEGPARDNPIEGPRTGTKQSEPSAPASAGASGRRIEPGSLPASACPAQPPSKARGASPRGRERHHGVRKADQSTESDRTGRGAAHHAGPRGTPERHTAGDNQGTRTGAKQQRLPGAANPESGHNTQGTTAQEQVPSNTSRRADGRVLAQRVPSPYRLRTAAVRMDECARRVPSPCRLQTAAIRMDECAPGGYQAPAGYGQPPSGWTSERPAATPRTRTTARTTQSTAHRASTPVNKSQAA